MLLSSFCIEDDWINTWIPSDIPLCFIRPRTEELPKHVTHVQASSKIMYVFPPMRDFGCMHVKLIVLWYPDRIRVIIPSANLIELDWTDMENIVFIQDFPKGQHISTPFDQVLCEMLSSMKVPNQVILKFKEYDFSQALGQLVYSRPVSETRGLLTLKQIVKDMKTDFTLAKIACQGSSLGRMTPSWVKSFVAHCKGKDSVNDQGVFSLIYPSLETIVNSRLGPLGGGSFFLKESFVNPYLNSILRECKSVNRGGLMHSKIILCHLPELDVTDHVYITRSSDVLGYMYCGSHNTTPSAWGFWTKNGLMMNNWELGIVVRLGRQGDKFRVPFEYPAKSYHNTVPWASNHQAIYFETT